MAKINKMDDKACAWAANGEAFFPTYRVAPAHLPVGVYAALYSPSTGPCLEPRKINTDGLINLPASDDIVNELRRFTAMRETFRSFGLIYKRGILLHGEPGCGKTSVVHRAVQMALEERDAICVLVENPEIAAQCFRFVRDIEPERRIIAVMEDLDSLCSSYEERDFLSLLDGDNQIDNIVYLATTNFPDKLDKRFLDRPSRFDLVTKIAMPSAASRYDYLTMKFPDLPVETVEDYVASTDGLSMAHVKELVILTRAYKIPLDEAIKRLRGMHFDKPENAPAQVAVAG